MRLFLPVIALTALCAMPLQSHAQKGKVVLRTQNDSLSYAIGTQIGGNVRRDLHRSNIDNLNMELLRAGFNAGLDSNAMALPADQCDGVVSRFMTKKREEQMARDNAAAAENLKKGQAWLAENAKKPGITSTASGLQYEVLTAGTGPKPSVDDQVEVHYRGTLTDGTEFDSSYKRGQPATFSPKGVIKGWTEVLQLMPQGSKWRVYIPSDLGYGARGSGPSIPGNSVLIFDIELLKVIPKQ